MKAHINENIELPEGTTATYAGKTLTVKGSKGEVVKSVFHPNITITVDASAIILDCPVATQREKRHIYTLAAHIRNMIHGANNGHSYKVKVCSGHFPMNVSVGNGVLTVKNFLGEAVPRVLKLKEGVDVKLNGDIIEITSVDIEKAGAQASDIEQLTRITNRDRRIFQDGLYIIEKNGVQL